MDIDPKLLRIFTTVLRCGSVTRAADLLHLSQPSISKAIKRLESVVGFALFEPSGRGLRPTTAAELLHEDALLAERELERVRHRILQIRQGHKRGLRIATIPALGTYLLPQAIIAFQRLSPETRFEVEIWPRDRILADAGVGTIDFGLIHSATPDVPPGFEILANAPLRCLLPAAHPLTQKTVIAPEDLRQEKLLVYHHSIDFADGLWRLLEEHGLASQVVLQASQTTFLRDMVRLGEGLTLIDGFTAQDRAYPGLVSRPFAPNLPFYAAVALGRLKMASDARHFLDTLKVQARSLASRVI